PAPNPIRHVLEVNLQKVGAAEDERDGLEDVEPDGSLLAPVLSVRNEIRGDEDEAADGGDHQRDALCHSLGSLSQDRLGQKGDERFHQRRTANRCNSGGDHTCHDADGDDDLADVLTLDAAELIRLTRKVGGGGKELFPDERVVARGDEERELGGLCGTGYLDRTNAVARFGED